MTTYGARWTKPCPGTTSNGDGFGGILPTPRTNVPTRWRARPFLEPAESFCSGLELAQNMLGARNLKGSGRFHVQFFDSAVIDEHRITLAPLAHAES